MILHKTGGTSVSLHCVVLSLQHKVLSMERKKLKKSFSGGHRVGAGRPLGSVAEVTKIAREAAREKGLLPHEFLLAVTRGEPIRDKDGTETKPTMAQRMEAAKAAAPYYAPRMATVEVIQALTDDDLDSVIKGAAAEIGIDLGFTRKGETSTATPIPPPTGPTTVH